MTKEEKIAVFKAWLDGAVIEYQNKSAPSTPEEWFVVSDPVWGFNNFNYRIHKKKVTNKYYLVLCKAIGGTYYQTTTYYRKDDLTIQNSKEFVKFLDESEIIMED